MSLLASLVQSQKQTGQDLIHDITAFIEQNYQNDVSLYDIANRFHVLLGVHLPQIQAKTRD